LTKKLTPALGFQLPHLSYFPGMLIFFSPVKVHNSQLFSFIMVNDHLQLQVGMESENELTKMLIRGFWSKSVKSGHVSSVSKKTVLVHSWEDHACI
jgi:hypothetical protein